MTTKHQLLNKMVDTPLQFTEENFQLLVSLEDENGDKQVSFDDLRNNLLRIYDMNERLLVDASNPMLGNLKKPNERSTKKRRKIYYKKIKEGFTKDDRNLIVVAEGDSWFQFPMFIKDIIDWLMDCKQLAIYSLSAAGDWMANMIYEGKYIEELSIHKPNVFLISGGGNDFIGGNRLSIMVNKQGNCSNRYTMEELNQYKLSDEERTQFFQIQKYINQEFYAFIWTLKTQYWILFEKLGNGKKFPGLQIITQGYDNVIPSFEYRWNWQNPLQYFVNRFVQTGQWLKTPLQIKGINDEGRQRWIMRYLIFNVNEMFIQLVMAQSDGKYMFPNVFHIDCRHVAKGYDDWYDEIHLKSAVFKKVAEAYKDCIFHPQKDKKVYLARDY